MPRFSRYWDQALFENGFARFQNEDFGGALGSLQALHAPQFAGAFQPESWILKATIYYFSCLYDEVKTTLAAYDELYVPMAEQLEPIARGTGHDPGSSSWSTDQEREAADAGANWVRSNERMLRGVHDAQADRRREEAASRTTRRWRGGASCRTQTIDLARGRAEQLLSRSPARSPRTACARRRTTCAASRPGGDHPLRDVEGREGAGRGRRRPEGGAQAPDALPARRCRRENWNYWKFQGEFWIDEIGYYQYTLKRGCPAGKE